MVAGELIVGGVFIRLYNTNPSWAVRHPRQFATELMEKVLELMQKPNEHLRTVTTAFVGLITNHPTTADQVRFESALQFTSIIALDHTVFVTLTATQRDSFQIPAQGYLPQFCLAMNSPNTESARSALHILQHLAENTVGKGLSQNLLTTLSFSTAPTRCVACR